MGTSLRSVPWMAWWNPWDLDGGRIGDRIWPRLYPIGKMVGIRIANPQSDDVTRTNDGDVPRLPCRFPSAHNRCMETTPSNATPRIGIVTVSDRASRGEYVDRGGPAIVAYLQDVLDGPWEAHPHLVADDRDALEILLRELADQHHCDLVITTGGTGPASRDITPEATEAVCVKLLPGFGELMRKVSLEKVPTAILSRQTAGIRGRTLFLNLPGQPRAIQECLDAVFAAIPYCVDLIGGAFIRTNPAKIVAFRPGT